MPRYRLTGKAKDDLLEITLYGIARFGTEQFRRYIDKLKRRFEELAERPERYPMVQHIHKGYRRSVCGVHSIYYRIEEEEVIIVRILGRQKPEEALQEWEISSLN